MFSEDTSQRFPLLCPLLITVRKVFFSFSLAAAFSRIAYLDNKKKNNYKISQNFVGNKYSIRLSF